MTPLSKQNNGATNTEVLMNRTFGAVEGNYR